MSEATLKEPIELAVCKSIRVLHVDDDAAFLNMAKQCLEVEADIQVDSVDTVPEALRLLETEKFDVVVSDYEMNQTDGLEFLQEIKTRGIATPFILFTGKGREEVAIKALNSGAFRYLNKRGAPDAAHAELASCIRQATQYTRNQQKLEENERRFRAVFDSSIDAILVLNDNGDVIYCNKAAKDMLYYGKCEITDALQKHFTRQFRAAYERNMQQGFRELDSNLSMAGEIVEISIKKCSGETAVIELSFSAFAENGQWYGVSVARDVTERKRQEKLLEESQETLKALFSLSPEAIVFVDKDLRVTKVNQSFEDLFGFTFKNVKGKKIADVIVPEGLEKESEDICEMLLKGPVSFNTVRKRCDGSVLNVGLSAGPLVVSNETVGYFMVFLNISNLIEAQNELKNALSNSEVLNEKIKVLGSLTRHDVRNKLGIIEGNLYLARKKCKVEPNLEQYLSSVALSVKNITEILNFAKTYEMIGVEKLVPVNLGRIFQDALSLFTDPLSVKHENQCMGLEVMADSLLTDVLYNLIENSVKHPEKVTAIRIAAEKLGDGSVKVCYKDDGVGFDAAAKQRLFERGAGKGGFGLYLAREICSSYGWTIKETGEEGLGAQFEIVIPIEKVIKFSASGTV